MRVLGLIPARGGSTRLARKNMLELGGVPLIARTIMMALEAKCLARVVVSTEDEEIASYTSSIAVDDLMLLKRPVELAQNDTPTLPVVRHAMDAFPYMDAVMVLQATSPFRNVKDITEAYWRFSSCRGDALVSLVKSPADLCFEVGGPFHRVRPPKGLYVPNGAIYMITREALEAGNDFYDGVCYGYVMPPERSLDIDTAADMGRARAMFNGMWGSDKDAVSA